MLPLLLSIGFVGGLVALAIKDTADPAIKPAWEINRLKQLKAQGRWTLDQAEDTLTLAKRYKDSEAEKKFTRIVALLRAKRVKI